VNTEVSPLVSVIIPAFNAEQFVGAAVESVLHQTHSRVECIVIDDGSIDGTVTEVRRHGSAVRCVSQPNRGVSAARNKGVAEARGDLLAFLDADDVWLPTRLERQLPLVRNHDASVVLCAATRVDQALRPIGLLRTVPIPTRKTLLLYEGALSSVGSSALVTRKCFTLAGGFDERLSTSADWEFLLRAVTQGPVGYVDEPLVLYRKVPGSMGTGIAAMEHDLEIAYRDAFVRWPELKTIRRRAYARMHWMLAGSYYHAGKRKASAKQLGKALAYEPTTVVQAVKRSVERRRCPSSATRRIDALVGREES
jgi:glycosyltransferase involved in cell wall biosynthesis